LGLSDLTDIFSASASEVSGQMQIARLSMLSGGLTKLDPVLIQACTIGIDMTCSIYRSDRRQAAAVRPNYVRLEIIVDLASSRDYPDGQLEYRVK
jgi:hypothetical protein